MEIGVSKAVDGTEGGKGDDRRNNGGGGGGGGDDDADDGDGDVGGSNYYELKWLDDIEKYANDENMRGQLPRCTKSKGPSKISNERIIYRGTRGTRGTTIKTFEFYAKRKGPLLLLEATPKNRHF